jgi:hypothetical protein
MLWLEDMELERVPTPHSSKLTVDKCLLRKGSEKKSLTFSYVKSTGESLIHRKERNCGGEIPKLSHELKDDPLICFELNRLSLPTLVCADVHSVDALRVPQSVISCSQYFPW